MKKILTAILFVLAITSQHIYAVDVPDFSFKGEEIASFAITPVFRDIDLQMSVPSEYTNYVQKQSIAISGEENISTYQSDAPSFWYSYSPTTAIASIFVGDRAYRNFLVKKFLAGEYPAYVKEYESYAPKLKTTEYQEEAELLLAVSEINNMAKSGENKLYNVCLNGEFFKDEACDKYIEILWNRKNYTSIIDAVSRMKRPLTEFTFSAYALSTLYRKDYAKANTLLNQNPDMLFKYPDFNDVRATVEYYNSHYTSVVALIPYTTDNISFITTDSLINIGQYTDAQKKIASMSNKADKDYLTAKLMIVTGRHKELGELVNKVSNEDDRFVLMKLYVSKTFPKMDQKVLSAFRFSDPEKSAYVTYYTGLAKMELKDYKNAAEILSRVKAPAELAASATFYRGIALVYIDPAAAEKDIITILNTSNDPAQISASRFMLAQVYYMKGNYDPAMQLVESCQEIYCRQLMSEIYLKKLRFDDAIKAIDGINTPQANFSRASAYYNLMQYDAARLELDKTGSTSREAQHLRMMLLFKEGNLSAATAILTANREYTPILYDGVKELMLAGDYRLAAKLLEDEKDLPPDMQIVNARILGWLGKDSEAKAIYTRLLKSRVLIYDCLFGQLSLEKSQKDELQLIYRMVQDLPSYGDFPQKDLLLAQIAAKASRADDKVLLIQIINMFFPTYATSEYAADMYYERAKLFYDTGRSSECIQDINQAVQANPAFEAELRLIKAQCTETVNKEEAVQMYLAMFRNDDRYRLPAAVKLMDLSDSPPMVLEIAKEIRTESPQLYIEGIRRYVEIADAKDLEINESYLATLSKSKDNALACAGLFGMARLANERGSGRDAAKIYRQVFQTDQKDHFAIPSLEAAVAIYTQLKMPKEAAETQDLLTKHKSRK